MKIMNKLIVPVTASALLLGACVQMQQIQKVIH